MRRLIIIGLVIVLGAAILTTMASTCWLRSFGARPSGERLDRMRRSAHFADGKFVNSMPTELMAPGSFFTILRHQLLGNEERVPKRQMPIVARKAHDFAQGPASELRATWMGHAFNLAFHAWNEPAERVLATSQRAGVALVIPRPGEFIEPTTITSRTEPQAIDEWWR